MSLRPFNAESGRQSPFKRQNSSASPASARATTPTLNTSPTKPSTLSPTKSNSLSPEKTSPFVRRPSQISKTPDRPASPLARPSSSLSIPASSSRQQSPSVSGNDEPPSPSPRFASVASDPDDLSPIRSTRGPSPFDGPASDLPPPSQPNFHSSAQRSERASSTTSTIKPLSFTKPPPSPSGVTKLPHPAANNGGYNHVPAPLLRSMRESFEVLDASNAGSINAASVAAMLEQMGLPNTPADVRDFFPPSSSNFPSQLNLARYLDILSAPLAELSQNDELAAAFSAFDVDDSGQIDLAELRSALLNTVPERGEQGMVMSEREVDGILGEFAGRRAFGAKGINVAKGKGEVFRWREFMGSVTGGATGAGGVGQDGVAVV